MESSLCCLCRELVYTFWCSLNGLEPPWTLPVSVSEVCAMVSLICPDLISLSTLWCCTEALSATLDLINTLLQQSHGVVTSLFPFVYYIGLMLLGFV